MSSIGYLAQDVPLYKRLSVRGPPRAGSSPKSQLGFVCGKRPSCEIEDSFESTGSTLSGGQRAQVGLGLALAKRPSLLLLDEPVAALDPLARREFLASLTEAVAESDLSVILSSHLLHDLERVCDHVILLSAARVQICEDIEDLLASHRMLVGRRQRIADVEPNIGVIKATQTANQTRLVARIAGPILDPSWEMSEVGLEDIIVAYMGQDELAEEPLSMIGAAQ